MFPVLIAYTDQSPDDALGLALIAQSLQEYGRYVKLLTRVDSRISIAWVSSPEVAKYLVFRGPVKLTSELSCSFSAVPPQPGNMIELSFFGTGLIDIAQQYQLVRSILRVDHGVSISNQKLCLNFQSCELASRAMRLLEDTFHKMDKPWSCSIAPIRLDQLEVVTFTLKGRLSIDALGDTLMRQGVSFVQLVQNRLRDRLLDPPLIVEARLSQMMNCAFLIVYSKTDANKVASCDCIMLAPDCVLELSSDELSSSRSDVFASDDISVAWDNISAITNPSMLTDHHQSGISAITNPSTLTEHHQSGINGVSLWNPSLRSIGNAISELDSFPRSKTAIVEKIVEIQSRTMAILLQKLLHWGELSDDFDNMLGFADPLSKTSELLGPSISIEERLGIPVVVVRAPTTSIMDMRCSRIRQCMGEAIKNTGSIVLSNWKVQHKVALQGSNMLLLQEEQCRSSVAFQSMDKISVSCEIQSLSIVGMQRMADFLSNLRPISTSWRLPHSSGALLNSSTLRMLQHKCSLYAEIVLDQPEFVSLQVFGFSDTIEQAQRILQDIVFGSSLQLNEQFPDSTPRVDAFHGNSVEKIRKIHRGMYSFSDREAGIFFFAYEQYFRDYLEKSFCVLLEDSDSSVDNKSKCNRDFAVTDAKLDSMLNKNVVLKVSFYGNSLKNVSSARTYLEQLNTTNLARVQIFFPQVSIRKYKEIYNKRSTQLTMLNNERMRGSSQVTSFEEYSRQIVDPLHSRGFVNIRMKPPMHFHGIRKMQLPADVTVTICGSILAPGNEELLKEVELVFNSIQSDYWFVSVSIPYTHPLKKQLTIKSMREEIIMKYGLVALKWEEGCRATGSIGTAKIWALYQASLDSLLGEIRSAELELGTTTSNAFGVSYTPQSQFELAFAQSALCAQTTTESLTGAGLSNDGISGSDVTSLQSQDSRIVVYLPDLTLRYVLLGPPLNAQMTELLQKFNSQGIKTKYPYRDRSDPHAAALLEGESTLVAAAAKEANDLVLNATKELQSVQVVVSDEQYRIVLANDLSCVKFVQGQAGVHMKLDPTAADHEQAISLFDLRFIRQERAKMTTFERGVGALVEPALSSISISGWPGSPPTEIYVSSAFSTNAEWAHQIQQVVVIHIDEVTAVQFLSDTEKNDLKEGHGVHVKLPGTTLESVHWLVKNSLVVEDLYDVIEKSCTHFLQNGVSTVAILLALDSKMDTDRRCIMADGLIRAIFGFCYPLQLMGIQIVCAEFDPTLATKEKETGCSDDQVFSAVSSQSSIAFAMARSLLRLIDSQGEPSHSFAAQAVDHRVATTQCNIQLSPVLHKNFGQYSQRGQKIFVMKGLLPGLETGIAKFRQVLLKGGVKQ